MAKKKVTGNHITSSTETLVVRVPKSIKRAYEAEATDQNLAVGKLVREDLARGIKRRGYELE